MGEIAILRLPQHECIRRLYAIAVLKAKRSRFRKRAIEDRKGRACPREMLQGNILLSALLIVQHRVTVAERTPFAILSCQANRRPIRENRGKSQRFGLSPIDASFRTQRRRTPLQQARQLAIGSESLRPDE